MPEFRISVVVGHTVHRYRIPAPATECIMRGPGHAYEAAPYAREAVVCPRDRRVNDTGVRLAVPFFIPHDP